MCSNKHRAQRPAPQARIRFRRNPSVRKTCSHAGTGTGRPGEVVFWSCFESEKRLADEVAVDFQSKFGRERHYAPVGLTVTHCGLDLGLLE